MHDFRPFPGRIIGAVASGSEIRRLVGYQAAVGLQQQQLPVKCPRCDSTNTKFCYYNNYNLSQPRHFCKSCRRYWTKGGVLRNVPVGGGCRKSKRTSSSSSSRPPAKSSDKDPQRRHAPSSVSGCSSDGLTAAVVASPSTWIPDSILANSQIPVCNPNPPMEPSVPSDSPLCPARDIYQDPSPKIGFSFSDSPLPQVKTVEMMRAGFVDQTVPVGTRAGEGSSVLAAMDWFGSVDPHLFDATDVVDPTGYWNQSHWADADPNLYLP